MTTMMTGFLMLFTAAPLIAAAILPNAVTPTADVAGAVLLTCVALFIIGMMARWLNRPNDAPLFRALGWRCRLLQFSIVAIFATIAGLMLFIGPTLNAWHYGILSSELGLLMLAAGLTSMVAPRNRVLGFRTPRTLANDETWHLENRVWGRRLALASLLAPLAAFTGAWGPLLVAGIAFIVGIWFLIEDRRRGRS